MILIHCIVIMLHVARTYKQEYCHLLELMKVSNKHGLP